MFRIWSNYADVINNTRFSTQLQEETLGVEHLHPQTVRPSQLHRDLEQHTALNYHVQVHRAGAPSTLPRGNAGLEATAHCSLSQRSCLLHRVAPAAPSARPLSSEGQAWPGFPLVSALLCAQVQKVSSDTVGSSLYLDSEWTQDFRHGQPMVALI